jgi:glutamine cyclotransferase
MSKGLASVVIAAMILGGAIAMFVNLTGTPTLKPAVPLSPDPAPIRKYDVVAEYPHDPQALT